MWNSLYSGFNRTKTFALVWTNTHTINVWRGYRVENSGLLSLSLRLLSCDAKWRILRLWRVATHQDTVGYRVTMGSCISFVRHEELIRIVECMCWTGFFYWLSVSSRFCWSCSLQRHYMYIYIYIYIVLTFSTETSTNEISRKLPICYIYIYLYINISCIYISICYNGNHGVKSVIERFWSSRKWIIRDFNGYGVLPRCWKCHIFNAKFGAIWLALKFSDRYSVRYDWA